MFKKKNTELIVLKVKNGKFAYAQNYDSFQSRGESTVKMFLDALKLNRTKFNGKLTIHTGDFPETKPGQYDFYYCCKHASELDSVIPDFIFDGWPQAGIDSYSLITKEISEKGSIPFTIPKMLWIGNSKTHPRRTAFLEIAEKNSTLIDGFDTCVDKYIVEKKKEKYISLSDHTKYKYLIDIEGRGYSGRLKLLLFSKRVLFVQERLWKEFYHFDMIPYEHYIPIKNDLSDLIDQIHFVEQKGDEYYNEITKNAYSFACKYLSYDAAILRINKLIENLK